MIMRNHRYVFLPNPVVSRRIITMLNAACEGLDYEWIELILEAIEMGISETEIRKFLFVNQVKTAEVS